MLMNRSFRLYLEGDKVTINRMTIKEVKEYLIQKALMMERPIEEAKENYSIKNYTILK